MNTTFHWLHSSIDSFHVTSWPPCWWTKTRDLSLASFVRPPEVVRFSIVIGVSRDWLKSSYSVVHPIVFCAKFIVIFVCSIVLLVDLEANSMRYDTTLIFFCLFLLFCHL